MALAVYPGSFDPVTNGHLNIIRRAVKLFDQVIVAVAYNVRKKGLFSVQERLEMLEFVTRDIPGVEVDSFQGLLVNYMQKRQATVVLRGLRAISDFEYEFQMAHMNNYLAADIETVFMMTGAEEFYISSNIVKEVASLYGDVSGLVPGVVEEYLRRKNKK